MNINNVKNVLLKYEDWLQTNKFDHFIVLKTFVNFERKEITAIVDKMNDDVLEEFYDKTFDITYKCDDEIVFMIVEENAIQPNKTIPLFIF